MHSDLIEQKDMRLRLAIMLYVVGYKFDNKRVTINARKWLDKKYKRKWREHFDNGRGHDMAINGDPSLYAKVMCHVL